MAFFTTKVDEKSISESDFEYIKQSGIYDCKIKFVSVKVNTHGARSLDFNVEYKGSSLTLYGLKLDNNDGSENFQRKTFNKLCIIAGLESIDDPIERVHVVGKEKKEQEFKVLEQFDDLDVKIRVRFRYSKYEGKIRETPEIMGFYRASDGATAAEILNETQVGVQLEKDLKYASENKYDDGLTVEEVEAWKAEGKGKDTATKQPSVSEKKENPFKK